MADTHQLIKFLRSNIALQSRNCHLLEAEQKALMACNRPLFCELHARHNELLREMQQADFERKCLLTAENGSVGTIGQLLALLPARERRVAENLRDTLRKISEHAGALCLRNRMLIRNEVKYMSFMMDLFIETGRNEETKYSSYAAFRGRALLDRRA